MSAFRDADGTEWKLPDFTFGLFLKIKRESGGRFNLLDPAGPFAGDDKLPLLHAIQYDPVAFWELLCYLLASEMERRGVAPEAFADLILAECFTAAQDCFLADWLDFFQKLRQPALTTLLEKAETFRTKAIAMYREKANDPAIDAEVERAMAEELSRSFGSAVASLGSTPGRSPPANSS